MSALWVKYIQNATHWDLTELEIQCGPKYKCSSYTKRRKRRRNDKLFIEWKQKIENEKKLFFEKTG